MDSSFYMAKLTKDYKNSKRRLGLKGIAVLLAINVIVIASLIYACELYLKYTDPTRDLPKDGIFEGKRYTWGHRVLVNKAGYRERIYKFDKAPGLYRVIVLGDSFTWGVGLAEKERFTNILEKLLSERYPKRSFEVLNFGINGYTTANERNVLGKTRLIFKPDLVIVGFCINDTQPKIREYSVEKEEFNKKYEASIDKIVARLTSVGLPFIGKATKGSVYGVAQLLGYFPSWEVGLQRTYETESTEWKTFLRALKDIKYMTDSIGNPPPIFASLNQAAYTDRPTDYANPDKLVKVFLRWYHQAEEAAGKAGFRTLNYEKEIAEKLPGRILALNEIDLHATPELNVVYAEKLFDVISKEYIGPPAAAPEPAR
jgi:hypothetical protein